MDFLVTRRDTDGAMFWNANTGKPALFSTYAVVKDIW